jgi:hypothetical protein
MLQAVILIPVGAGGPSWADIMTAIGTVAVAVAAVWFLKNPYPVVRWADRWGTRWEHRRGEVRQVRDDEPWSA